MGFQTDPRYENWEGWIYFEADKRINSREQRDPELCEKSRNPMFEPEILPGDLCIAAGS